MPKQLSRERSAGLGKESTYGVAVPPTHWVPWTEFNINDRRATITDNSAIGTRDDVLAIDTDYRYSDGNLNGVVYDRLFGLIALAGWGSVVTTDHPSATGVKKHVFTFANSLPSFSIAGKDANESKRFAGALLGSLEISAQTGSFATYTSSWLGRKSADAANTPALVQQTRFRPENVKLYVADSVEELDSADKACMTSFTFGLNNNLSTNACLGSEDPDFDPGVRGLSLSLNKTYVDTEFKDMVMGTAPKAFRIEMKNTAVQIGTSSPTNPSVTLDFETGLFSEWSREGGLDDLMTEAINYQPLRSFATGKSVTLTITNTETSY
jgi:hypothetical protein